MFFVTVSGAPITETIIVNLLFRLTRHCLMFGAVMCSPSRKISRFSSTKELKFLPVVHLDRR